MYSFCCVVNICLDTSHMMLVYKPTFLMPPKGEFFPFSVFSSFDSYNHIFNYFTVDWIHLVENTHGRLL